MTKNIKLNENFTQVCVWRGVTLQDEEIKEFSSFFENNFNVKAQFLERCELAERTDLIFAISDDSIQNFILPKMEIGASWIEDAMNNSPDVYPSRFKKYRSWKSDEESEA